MTIQRILALAFAAFTLSTAQAQDAPSVDHHQHLFSPMASGLMKVEPLSARDLIALLDAAGIRRAVLLSVAYTYGRPGRQLDDEYAKVKEENDWTAGQAAQYPDRLIAFCSFNPLKDYALEELERCAGTPGLRRGIKLHFGNSDVQLDEPAHVARLKQIFAAANQHRMAIAVHMRASISKQRPYGAAQARTFLEQLLPAAPDVTVQVAHFAGAGPGYTDQAADEAMGVLADAVERGDPRTAKLMFDVASIVDADITPEDAARVVRRIRQVGPERILYGSDAATSNNLRPREGWAAFRRLPLKPAEFERIAGNVAPYFAQQSR